MSVEYDCTDHTNRLHAVLTRPGIPLAKRSNEMSSLLISNTKLKENTASYTPFHTGHSHKKNVQTKYNMGLLFILTFTSLAFRLIRSRQHMRNRSSAPLQVSCHTTSLGVVHCKSKSHFLSTNIIPIRRTNTNCSLYRAFKDYKL